MDGRTHTREGLGERTERAEWEIKQAVPLWTLISPFSVPLCMQKESLERVKRGGTDRDAEKVCREKVQKRVQSCRGVLYVKSACLCWLGNFKKHLSRAEKAPTKNFFTEFSSEGHTLGFFKWELHSILDILFQLPQGRVERERDAKWVMQTLTIELYSPGSPGRT